VHEPPCYPHECAPLERSTTECPWRVWCVSGLSSCYWFFVGWVDNCRVEDRASRDEDGLADQVMVRRIQPRFARLVLLDKATELADGRLVRRRSPLRGDKLGLPKFFKESLSYFRERR
jgi:hypothetical protein